MANPASALVAKAQVTSLTQPSQAQVQPSLTKAQVLVIGDLHFQSNKIQFAGRVGRAILAHLKQFPTKYQAIVVLGDTLHYFSKIECHALTAATYFFRQLTQYAPLHVLIGNHDRPSNRDFLSELHPFTGLEGATNITIYSKPGWFTVNGCNFVCVPYVPDGRLGEALQYLNPAWDPSKITAVFSHQNIQGAVSDTGQKLSRGDIWHDSWPLLINGHIHEYQVISHNVVCPGAPAQHQHVGTKERSISAFYFGAQELLQATNGAHGSYWREERFYLQLPHLERIDLDANNILQWQLPQDENYYKLVIHGTSQLLKSLKSHLQVRELQKCNRISLQWAVNDQPQQNTQSPPVSAQTDFYTDFINTLDPQEAQLVQQLLAEMTNS